MSGSFSRGHGSNYRVLWCALRRRGQLQPNAMVGTNSSLSLIRLILEGIVLDRK